LPAQIALELYRTIRFKPETTFGVNMKYKDFFIGMTVIVILYAAGRYLYQGQEESNAFYTKGHAAIKHHR
jgi:hypothetical protein